MTNVHHFSRSPRAKSKQSEAVRSSAETNTSRTFAMAHNETELPVFARPTSSALGKATEPIKSMLPMEVKDDLTKLWRSLGYGSESDFLRELVMVRLYGSDFMANLHAQRIRGVSQNLTTNDQGS